MKKVIDDIDHHFLLYASLFSAKDCVKNILLLDAIHNIKLHVYQLHPRSFLIVEKKSGLKTSNQDHLDVDSEVPEEKVFNENFKNYNQIG